VQIKFNTTFVIPVTEVTLNRTTVPVDNEVVQPVKVELCPLFVEVIKGGLDATILLSVGNEEYEPFKISN
jgi:hypothetical protein